MGSGISFGMIAIALGALVIVAVLVAFAVMVAGRKSDND